MAWCPSCGKDKPTKQKEYDGPCPICKNGFVDHTIGLNTWPHGESCRGAAAGYLDVCDLCHTPVFAAAMTSEEFAVLEQQEKAMTQFLAGNAGRNWSGASVAIVIMVIIAIILLYAFCNHIFLSGLESCNQIQLVQLTGVAKSPPSLSG